MKEQHLERRLAAILAMDVAGYSRLMGVDEVGTLQALKAHRKGLIDSTIASHHGRIVKTTGDGMLVEFASVVDAIACAAAIQRGMITRNTDVPQERRIEFRAGINIGDVIVEGEDIYGDGVNVAARLENLSEPGGMCISRTVRDHVRDKLTFKFVDLGEQTVKNIARPVRVYGLGAAGIAALPESTVTPSTTHRRRAAVWLGAAVVAVLVVAGGAAGLSWRFIHAAPAVPSTAVDNGPSIAVLPFANLSGDKSQDYFSDGLTEDIVTELARIPRLAVMSRSATAKYKGQAVDIPQVGRELGVRYMLEGSVQRVGDQVRITAQLIEVATGAHVWAERYDRPTTEIFAVQDELTLAIAGSLVANMSHEDLERAKRKPPASLSAYELFLRGREEFFIQTPEATERAVNLFQQALVTDPTYADAMGALAQAYSAGFTLHWGPLRGQAAIDHTYETAQHALALDPTSIYATRALSMAYLFSHRIDEAVALLEQALKSNPSNDALLSRLGDTYTYAGQPERGVDLLRQVYKVNPRYAGVGHAYIGRGLLLLNRHGEAIAELKTCMLRVPGSRVCHEVAAVTYAEMGRLDEARAEVTEAHRLDPEFTLTSAPEVLPFKNPQDLQRFLDGLRKAGLPEK